MSFSGVCQEQSDRKNSLLVFNDGLQKLLKDTITYCDFDSNGSISKSYEARNY